MDLEQWAAALHDSLATRGGPGRLLYLYVDRADLAVVSGLADPDLALDDLCGAFRAEQTVEPFARQARAAEQWRRSGWVGPCPFLPALAMTVLAVTEEPLGSSHGVYRRLNDLLGLEPDAKEPPGYSSHVPQMWQIWNEWLTTEGAHYGRPSARSYPPYVYQGWARSQGIIRHRERLLIEDFVAGVPHARGRDTDRAT
ncbi:hypothetical protein FE634_12520 [Nocardioides dongxiaopingii]|uniref:hypothetical protein n=1 Tax=Nocardioides sp. S-1144 TaxID=2582905 RepID=UPI0011622B71|nr:hypothetical protein [Nocardioides sp. S-1144]QCW51020.2 hypothetical protein FE634_12520 [Nocardioides sp. S-1144]